jgi:hypothetical protein
MQAHETLSFFIRRCISLKATALMRYIPLVTPVMIPVKEGLIMNDMGRTKGARIYSLKDEELCANLPEPELLGK